MPWHTRGARGARDGTLRRYHPRRCLAGTMTSGSSFFPLEFVFWLLSVEGGGVRVQTWVDCIQLAHIKSVGHRLVRCLVHHTAHSDTPMHNEKTRTLNSVQLYKFRLRSPFGGFAPPPTKGEVTISCAVPSALREEHPAQGFLGGRAFRTLRRAASFILPCGALKRHQEPVDQLEQPLFVRPRPLQHPELPLLFRLRPLQQLEFLHFLRRTPNPTPRTAAQTPSETAPTPLIAAQAPSAATAASRMVTFPPSPWKVVPSPRNVVPATARLSRSANSCSSLDPARSHEEVAICLASRIRCCFHHPSIAAET